MPELTSKDKGYKLEPPFEIYHDGLHIADKNGHLCTTENEDIAKAILQALKIATTPIQWYAQ